MQGKTLLFFLIVFLFLCTLVYSQESVDNFISDFYWYYKYLPLENISEYQALRNILIHLKENDEEGFHRIGSDLIEPIQYLNNIVLDNIQKEELRVSQKIEDLYKQHRGNSKVISLAEQFVEFEHETNLGRFPHDDFCFDEIDALYSQLITRADYQLRSGNLQNPGYREYTVLRGDSMWKIALKHYDSKKNLWQLIWKDEINYTNRNFLPNPRNPNLIYPGVIIRIPPEEE